MRTRINKYTIIGARQIKLDTPITIEDVRLIINETKKIVIASSMQKDNITIEGGVITYTNALPISEVGDYFTIEIDKGETINDIIGENPNATNSKLLEEIKNIASFDSDLLQGKRKIASAISLKGIEASYTESLQDLSIKINQIPQKQYVSIGDDRFYYPQPYMQSIFNVAEDLKKTDMPDYIPTYMKEYKQMFGVNQFVKRLAG